MPEEALIKYESVTPAKAGVQKISNILDPGFRRDDLFRASLRAICVMQPDQMTPVS